MNAIDAQLQRRFQSLEAERLRSSILLRRWMYCANADVPLREAGRVKRFTDTEKWRDPWFRRLSPELKSFWSFVLDNCDPSGVWKVDMEYANFAIGGSLTEETVLAAMPGRFKSIGGGKWFILKFILFQYGELRDDCRPHNAVIRFLKEHGLHKEYLKSIQRVSDTLKDKEKDKDKEKEEGEAEGDLALNRVRSFFHKRAATPLDSSEQKAWKTARPSVISTSEQEWQLLEWVYKQSNGNASQYRRKDMATLLNNWNCEIDRAKVWRNGDSNPQKKRELEAAPTGEAYRYYEAPKP